MDAPARSSTARYISVIVPTRNRCDLLAEALASVRAIEGPDLELDLIVADNGSSDLTPDVARRYGARLVQTFVPGAAAARNAGLKAAKGEFIAFLDDDDVWLAGHLRPQLDVMEQNPDLAGVIGQVANAAPDLSSHGPFWPTGLAPRGDLFREFFATYPQIGATVVRRSVLESVGYFDEQLTYDQDWDWHLRLALRHPLGFVAEPCVLFRQRPAGQHDELQWRRMAFARRVFFANARRGGPRRSPGPLALARIYLRQFGHYYSYFTESAEAHLAASEPSAARRAVWRAFAASPLHWLRDAPHGRWLRPFRPRVSPLAHLGPLRR